MTIRQKEHGGVGVLWCYGAMEEELGRSWEEDGAPVEAGLRPMR